MHGGAKTDKAWPRLQSEYLMYEHFGGSDRHVNYIYQGLKPGKEQASYIYELYQRRVLGERPLRRNVSLKEMVESGDQSAVQFEDWLTDLYGYNAIDKGTLKMVYAMMDGEYESIYEYDY